MKATLTLILFSLLFSACGVMGLPNAATPSPPALEDITSPLPPTKTPSEAATSHSEVSSPDVIGLTYQSLDGNRYVEGVGSLPSAAPLDLPLSGTPLWVVGVPIGEDSFWVTALEDGRHQAFLVSGRAAIEAQITPALLEPGESPILALLEGKPQILNRILNIGSPSSHPVPLLGDGIYAFIQPDGNLAIQQSESSTTLAVGAMLDSRLLVDESGNILLLNRPTPYYDHGVLGDDIEAGGVVLVQTGPEPRVVKEIILPTDSVIEGILPIWSDITGDGVREIIVTQSGYEGGAQLVVYNQEGDKLGASAAIGQTYRWRHQIAVAPFGPNGKVELVDVLTPHIGGVVEFFQLEGSRLVKVAQVGGYTSHVIGSRNLDMAVAGDFDGDGLVELLLPSQDLSALGAIQRLPDSAVLDWTLSLDGHLNTNLAAIRFDNGTLALAAGAVEGVLRIWLP